MHRKREHHFPCFWLDVYQGRGRFQLTGSRSDHCVLNFDAQTSEFIQLCKAAYTLIPFLKGYAMFRITHFALAALAFGSIYAMQCPRSMAAIDIRGGFKCCNSENMILVTCPVNPGPGGYTCPEIERCGQVGSLPFDCDVASGGGSQPCWADAHCVSWDQEVCFPNVPCP